LETLVQSRRSERGFRHEPVPRAVIEGIIETAKRVPSSMNTQPWHIHVLTGAPLEKVRRRNMEEMAAGASCDQTSCARSPGLRMMKSS
jgi:nitroreductase